MPVTKLRKFLDDAGIKYVSIRHSIAYTAQEVAESAHVSGLEFAKTLIVKLDDTMAMAVLRAADRLDLDLLRSAAGAASAVLATENQFQGRFPAVDVGAMPPFGNLYDMPVYVDQQLAKDEEIVFNAGSYTEVVRLAYTDFERLVEPRVANFTQ